MKRYLVKEGDGFVVIGAVGFVPKNVITRVPDNISPEDFEFIEAKKITSETEDGEQEMVVAAVDNAKKQQILEQREQSRLEENVRAISKKTKKAQILKELAESGVDAPTGKLIRNLIRLILLDNDIQEKEE